MVLDAFLAIVAVCGVFSLCCIFHGQSVHSAGRLRLHFALLWGGRAERHLLHRPALCLSLVCMMPLIDIAVVRSVYARLYLYVPHRRIASAISATFLALWGTLRRPLTLQRGGA